jgi:DNA repair protein RadD
LSGDDITSHLVPAVSLRLYQRRAVNAAVLALKGGSPALLSLPTGSGKSLLAGNAAKRANAAGLRTLIIPPTRELVAQDAEAVRIVTGGALSASIACSGLGEVNLAGPLVIGTPQTLASRIDALGHIDLLVIDEAHRLGRKASGQLHSILTELRERSPKLMVLGLTATPFRLDSGRLIDGPDRIFEAITYDVGYLDLLEQGYLAPLVGPREELERLNVEGLRLVAGDYAAADLARFDRAELTDRIADQIVELGAERRSWLAFGVSIEHAGHLADALVARGIDARLLTGSTPAQQRADLVAAFKAGHLRALVGVDVFSTGFDAPQVDLIAVVRPTASPVWHVQSAGRGTRLAPGKVDCLVLDFAGNFARLGPIDAPFVRAKGQRARDNLDKPLTLACPECSAIVSATATSCPVCKTSLTKASERRADRVYPRAAGHAIITGTGTLPVLGVNYHVHQKPGRPDSLRLEYRVAGFRFPTVSEWLTAWHVGIAGMQAREEWRRRLRPNAPYQMPRDATEAVAVAPSRLRQPASVRISRDGDFTRVVPLFDQAHVIAGAA